MSAWSGKWNLKVATVGYSGVAVGKFTLKKVKSRSDQFQVYSTSGAPPAKWLGITFQLQTGQPGPTLPYPIPNSAKPEYLSGAGSVVSGIVKEGLNQQGAPIPGSNYEFLEADVGASGTPEIIWLFKVEKALVNKKDLLVGFKKADFAGGHSGSGSASGVRP